MVQACSGYRPRLGTGSTLQEIFRTHWDEFLAVYEERFEDRYGPLFPGVRTIVERYLRCGDPAHGFCRMWCETCERHYVLPFSCKTRLCLSCGQRRVLEWSAWLSDEVLLDVRHRHWVFTMPKRLWYYFRRRRELLTTLQRQGADLLMELLREAAGEPDAMPGVVSIVQTAGERLNWNPHLHMIATAGCLAADGRYLPATFIDYGVLRRLWRNRVLVLLVEAGALDEREARDIKRCYPKGFYTNGEIDEGYRGDRYTYPKAVMRRIAEYVMRRPVSERRIVCHDPASRTVLARYRLRDHESGSKTDLWEPVGHDALEYLALVCQHVPPPHQKLTNYYGLYSNAHRGKRKREGFGFGRPVVTVAPWETPPAPRGTWRYLIWRVYLQDPMLCPACGRELKIVELVCRDAPRRYAALRQQLLFPGKPP